MVDAVYDAFVAAIGKVGGALVDNEAGIIKNLWPDGHLNRHAIAQDADTMIAALNLDVPEGTEFVVVPTTELALTIPFQAKKLSLVLALYRAVDFDAAMAMTHEIQMHQGAGHSVGLHSSNDARPYIYLPIESPLVG